MLKGQIILWWGSLATIPAGWQHCNGTNGTPDLRFKFVRGAFHEASIGVTGGTANQTHNFTGDGHTHSHEGIPRVTDGEDRAFINSTTAVTGTTDNADNRPPFHTLAYIMKMFDDAQSQLELPWPYAAKAVIQHQHRVTFMVVWITFRHKMDIDNKPANAKWLVEVNGVPKANLDSLWLDPWTMQLVVLEVAGPTTEVTVEYDGPDELLTTAWDKQWEPWGPILSFGYPSFPATLEFSTGPAPQDDVDVTGIDVLLLDCSGNDVVIGGFVGGVRGQVLEIARLCAAANDATIEHNEGGGEQDIFLHKGLDETLTGEYGGWVLVCDGNDWYDTSHSKHV